MLGKIGCLGLPTLFTDSSSTRKQAKHDFKIVRHPQSDVACRNRIPNSQDHQFVRELLWILSLLRTLYNLQAFRVIIRPRLAKPRHYSRALWIDRPPHLCIRESKNSGFTVRVGLNPHLCPSNPHRAQARVHRPEYSTWSTSESLQEQGQRA